MRQSTKLMYYVVFFLVVSTLFLLDTYHKLNNEMVLLQEEKRAIDTIDIYHQLDVLLKEKRGLSQIDGRGAKLNINLLDYKIVELLHKLNNKKLVNRVKHLISKQHINKKNLFYEYTKVINMLNIEKIGFYNTSKYIFKQKEVNYLLNAIFVYELPSMIENIGKIRGIGSSILNNQNVEENERYILEDNLNNFKYTFHQFTNSISLNKASVLKRLSKLEQSVQELKEGKLQRDAYDYFVSVSKIIQDLNVYYSYGKLNIKDLIDEEIKNIQTSLVLYFVIYTIFSVIILFSIYRTYRINLFSKAKMNLERKERIVLHQLHQKLYACHDLKELCDDMLNILSLQFDIKHATIYMMDSKNYQMNLISTYAIASNKVEHILPLENNHHVQVLNEQSRIISGNELHIPLIFEDKRLATMSFSFNETFKKSAFSSKIIQLCADYIYKVQQNEENKKYFDLIDNYVLTSSTNKEGLITYVSNALCKNSQYGKTELLGRSHSLLKDPSFDTKIYTKLWELITEGKTFQGEIRNLKKDGTPYWLDVIISPQFGFYGDIIGYNSIRYDITDKKRVESIAIKDGLTNIYNRRFFDEIFPRKIQEIKRDSGYLVFALLDIDYFKQYNDYYGHSMGDEALKKVASVLQTEFKRTGDFVFRLGGEEFGLLFRCKSKADGKALIRNVLKHEVLKGVEHKNSLVAQHLSVSIGLYFIESKNQFDAKEIYELTDAFLYEVKKSSRNSYKSN